jgi:hypothetical protein
MYILNIHCGCTLEGGLMARKSEATGSGTETRARKNFRLPQSKLDAAQRVLGTRTETETVERALELVAFGERLASATERARGRVWNDVFGEVDPSPAEPRG